MRNSRCIFIVSWAIRKLLQNQSNQPTNLSTPILNMMELLLVAPAKTSRLQSHNWSQPKGRKISALFLLPELCNRVISIP
jgi:hypothetical protein